MSVQYVCSSKMHEIYNSCHCTVIKYIKIRMKKIYSSKRIRAFVANFYTKTKKMIALSKHFRSCMYVTNIHFDVYMFLDAQRTTNVQTMNPH